MRNKSIMLTGFIFLINTEVRAQDKLMHSYGATISVMSSKLTIRGTTATFTLVHTDLTYFPRLPLTQNDHSSVSLGVPLGVGLGIVSDVCNTSAALYWGVDVPVVVDYNFGCKSSKDNEDNFGGYMGAGFGYNYTNWKPGNGDKTASSYGPLARAGVRFGFANSGSDLGITVGVFYKSGLENEKFKTFGFNVLMDF